MAGPCWNTRSPFTRFPIDRVSLFHQLDLFQRALRSTRASADGIVEELDIDGCRIPIVYIRSSRARCYRLTLRPNGSARCTIPVRGSESGARQFVERCRPWLTRRLSQHRTAARPISDEWQLGTEIWWRGERTRISIDGIPPQVRLGNDTLGTPPATGDTFERVLRGRMLALSRIELPARLLELALPLGFHPERVSVRNQRSRWGSCSRHGTISLNWRLIQTPASVRDYILLHELAHLRHLNHSDRYWKEVARICPEYERAELWLRKSGKELL
ncbi:MAG: M48 family peptidase [Pedosphaera sp.]|nr:M48 family peptidase [Pedosphaera sp.]